jgi:2-methylcitrate dehydratase PrpD
VIAGAQVEFVRDLRWADVPPAVRERVRLLLADLAAVCVAGRPAPASSMAAAYASAVHPGDEATALLDGRRVGAVGAAWCNGVLANVLDYDDGHRLTKGHPGAVVIPAALAAAQLADATVEELLVAVVVGYEIAIRAGVALHARDDGYHASGAWGGLGAAAAAARLLGLDATAIHHAIGLAEYHAPIAHIMRSVAQPAMTKDACAWGASVGVSSALMAAGGFTAVDAAFLDEDAGDLGSSWRLEELYLKAYPCCRWSQGAIRAALDARAGEQLAADDVETVTVRTFAAADALAKVAPATTEEAQYNLVWPVATSVATGDFTVADVLGPWDDEAVASVMARTRVEIDAELTSAFPARRLTAVEIALRDGRRLAAGPLEAMGEPGSDGWASVVTGKVAALVDPRRDLAPSVPDTLGAATPAELLALLCDPVVAPARA